MWDEHCIVVLCMIFLVGGLVVGAHSSAALMLIGLLNFHSQKFDLHRHELHDARASATGGSMPLACRTVELDLDCNRETYFGHVGLAKDTTTVEINPQ
jgi:hypothetical protein